MPSHAAIYYLVKCLTLAGLLNLSKGKAPGPLIRVDVFDCREKAKPLADVIIAAAALPSLALSLPFSLFDIALRSFSLMV